MIITIIIIIIIIIMEISVKFTSITEVAKSTYVYV